MMAEALAVGTDLLGGGHLIKLLETLGLVLASEGKEKHLGVIGRYLECLYIKSGLYIVFSHVSSAPIV